MVLHHGPLEPPPVGFCDALMGAVQTLAKVLIHYPAMHVDTPDPEPAEAFSGAGVYPNGAAADQDFVPHVGSFASWRSPPRPRLGQ